MTKHIVAAYGTLMSGYGNHTCLGNSKMLGKGKTEDKMIMTARGIPYVSKVKKVSNISVEVYEVDEKTLQRLDHLEGHPIFYKREVTKINLDGGGEAKAWMYFCTQLAAPIVESGDYRDSHNNHW